MKHLPAPISIHDYGFVHRGIFRTAATIICLCCKERFVGDPESPACSHCRLGMRGASAKAKALSIENEYKAKVKAKTAKQNAVLAKRDKELIHLTYL